MLCCFIFLESRTLCCVQLETLGEFGVVFIVLCVALDFSPDKLRKVEGYSDVHVVGDL